MKKIILILLSFLPFFLHGQIDNYFGLLQNPAETGIEKYVFYTQQNAISRMPSAPVYQYGGFSHLFNSKKSGENKFISLKNVGAGGIFRIEKMGAHSDMKLEGLYSFRIGSENNFVNLGLSPVLQRRGYNLQYLKPKDLGDVLLENLPDNSNIFDLNIGIYWYMKPVSLSIAAYDLINHELTLDDYFYNIDSKRKYKGKITYKYENQIISFSPSITGHWTSVNDYSLIIQLLTGFFKDKINFSVGSGLHDFGSISELIIFGSLGYSAEKVNCFVYYGYNTSGLYKYSQGDLGIGFKYFLFKQVRNIEK